MKIIKVVINNSIINNEFDYLLPKNVIISVGCRVLISIKKKNYIGIVIKITYSPTKSIYKLKFISKIIDKKSLFNFLILNFAKKISQYYQYPIGSILFQILPIFLRKKNKFFIEKLDILQIKKINLLNNNKIIKYCNFKKIKKYNLTFNNGKFLSLYKKEFNFIQKNTNYNFYKKNICNILKNFEKEYFKNKFFVWITQNNIIFLEKIEIYLNIIKKILSQKKQILIIVPQYYFFFHLYEYFLSKLDIHICLLYSNFTNKKTLLIWESIKKGLIPIIIGTKFSIFTQFLQLGLIILTEEHNFIYRKTNIYKYNIRNIAILRAKTENIPIIISSNTLNVETIYNINMGKYKFLFKNNTTVLYKNFFKFLILDKNKKMFKSQFISKILIQMILKCIRNNEQIIIYYKYIGYSTNILCNFCQKILKCIDCDNNFVFYKKIWKLYCYFCKKIINMFTICPFCKKKFFIMTGIGIEQLIELLSNIFPKTLILNINNNNFLEKFLLIDNKKPLIIISSQTLYKEYFSFLKNSLIIFFNIDYILFSKNFKTTEYFIQNIFNILNNHLDKKKKMVIIQTYYPQNKIFLKIFKEYKNYYDMINFLLKEREKMLLPPFTKHISIVFESKNKKILLNFLKILKEKIMEKYINEKYFIIIGPLSLKQRKRKGFFRKQLILQHFFKKTLKLIINYILSIIKKIIYFKKIKFIINVDPI
ncbi:replication restart helicase PriA [Enterobacteriaceae endosymbiont of Donacia piscatrix]|uniref:replication restart helicase PriA n=1 Tax=Enterobacteriaceae endosymbiont of Donacia piscatrix TaxID=2675780 RepID=UPI001449FF21|nr:primosomal protein N' [Enterobacteriaceae endosymbiont of Donacia piscatrix]QJC35026.1 primosomal protein N' [Enterobacteriaceae endosymbiont of Donacia piscatrix]